MHGKASRRRRYKLEGRRPTVGTAFNGKARELGDAAVNTRYEINRHVVSDRVIRLALKGEFDLASAGELREALGKAIKDDQAAKVYVDLDQTTFIDSESIRALMWGYHTAHDAASQLILINPHGWVRKVLEITGVWQQLGSPTITRDHR